MRFFVSFSVISATLLLSNSTFANQSDNSLSQLIVQAQQKNIANTTTWKRLLYYPEQKSTKKSRIINRFNPKENQQAFFLHPNGATDPQAELTSLLTALFEPQQGDNHVECRFPARTHWVKQQLSINIPKVNCPTFDKWLTDINPQQSSIIFANETLDNLPSAFAHSFLHFANNNQQSFYLNYTPKVTQGESFIKFSYKSTIGGNAGEFSINDYQTGIQTYSEKQNRDMWHYPLHLTHEQNQQLARLVWEIKDQILPYYLLDENCASEILVLLNILFPDKNLLENFNHLIAPAQIVRRLQQQGLIDKTQLVPAKQTEQQFYINHNDKKLLENLVNDSNPLLANPLQRWQIGYQQQKQDDKNALQINYRLVYHDELDKPTGYPIGSYLQGLSATVDILPNAKTGQHYIQLNQATLLNLRQLKPVNTAKSGNSYGFGVGLQQVSDPLKADNNQHLTTHAHFEYGKSFAYGLPTATANLPPNLCYGLANGQTNIGKGLSHGYRIGVGANLGCIHQFSPNFRGLVDVQLPLWFSHDNHYWQPKISIGSQFDINSTHAIRLLASKNWQIMTDKPTKNYHEISLYYLHYFD